MASIYDVNPNQLIDAVALQLKTVETIQPPSWTQFCKTGMHKERAPENPDWWYIRAAAILRKYVHSEKVLLVLAAPE